MASEKSRGERRERTITVLAGDLRAGDRVQGVVVVRVDPTKPGRRRRWCGTVEQVDQVEVVGIVPSPIDMRLNHEARLTFPTEKRVQAVVFVDNERCGENDRTGEQRR